MCVRVIVMRLLRCRATYTATLFAAWANSPFLLPLQTYNECLC